MDPTEAQFRRSVRKLVDEHRDEIDDVRLCRLLGGIENDIAAGEYAPVSPD